MSFWQTSEGKKVTGSEEDSFAGSFSIIPDGTTAAAVIKLFELKDFPDGSQVYQITYKLADGEFKGQETRQKMDVFAANPKKADRAKNMMARVFKLCSHTPMHSDMPTNDDLRVMHGKILGIKIQEFALPKDSGGIQRGNWVSEVHEVAGFKSATGVKMEVEAVSSSTAFDRNPRAGGIVEDDLPF